MNVIGIVFLVIFLAVMVSVGVWGMKRTKTLGDFFLGGRTLGPWISAAAYGTTYFSAVIFIGYAGAQGWQFGLNALWIALGNGLIGAGLAWMVLARRTRLMTHNLDSMTMPEFLQERYGAKHLKPIAATIIF
ncbi:MAG: sodium transporter, partial [Treponema sp.]|nr:sodium transporter [Treponema sp.]